LQPIFINSLNIIDIKGNKSLIMFLTNTIKSSSSRPFYRYQRQFVLCESCFWCATRLYGAIKEKRSSEATTTTSTDNSTQLCPMCNQDSVALIPLQENEAYQMSTGSKRGLEIQFSLLKPKGY
jgi:hypothetical protein